MHFNEPAPHFGGVQRETVWIVGKGQIRMLGNATVRPVQMGRTDELKNGLGTKTAKVRERLVF